MKKTDIAAAQEKLHEAQLLSDRMDRIDATTKALNAPSRVSITITAKNGAKYQMKYVEGEAGITGICKLLIDELDTQKHDLCTKLEEISL